MVQEKWGSQRVKKGVRGLGQANILESKYGATSGVMKEQNRVSQQSWVTGGRCRRNGEAQRVKKASLDKDEPFSSNKRLASEAESIPLIPVRL